MNDSLRGLRRAGLIVALLNLSYFVVEFTVALAIGSVSLFADSIDFLEDTAINLLIVLAVGWSVRQRSRLGTLLAGIILVPGLATIWTAWHKVLVSLAPAPIPLAVTGLGALAVNFSCALLSSGTGMCMAASAKRPSCRRGTTPSPIWESSGRVLRRLLPAMLGPT